MRAIAPWLLALSGLVALQSTAAPSLEIYHVKPDFFLITVLLVAMRSGGAAVFWAVPAGFFQDLLSGGIIGFNLISKPAVALSVGLLRGKLDFENPNTQSVVTLAAAAAEGVVMALLLEAFQPQKGASWTIARIAVPAAVYSAVVLPVLYHGGMCAVRWVQRSRRRVGQPG